MVSNVNEMTLLQLFVRTSVLTVWTILILIFCAGCKKQWLQNRFRISAITIDSMDQSRIYLNFELAYYSDSTKGFYIMQGIEKGLDGADCKIGKIEVHGLEEQIRNRAIDSSNTDAREFPSLEDFKYHFNLKHRNTTGQRLALGTWVMMEPSVIEELKNKKTRMSFVLNSGGKNDTIFVTR